MLPAPPTRTGLVDLSDSGHYLHWGFFWLSWANAAMLGALLVLFVAALLLPFPGSRR